MAYRSEFRIKRLSHILASAAVVALAAPLLPTAALADEQTEAADSGYQEAFRSFAAGDYRTARVQLLNVIQRDDDNSLARILLARTSLALGNPVEAQTQLERAEAAGVSERKLRHLFAHALLMQGDIDEARDLLGASGTEPQFAAYAARLRGQLAVNDREFETAEREFNRALALAPNDPDTVNAVARFLVGTGQLQPARDLLQNILDQRPGHLSTLIAMGDIVRRMEGLEASLPYFSRAIEVDGNSIPALLERAATYGDLERDEESRADIQRVNRLIDGHPMARYLEAVLETRAGNTDRARELMQQTSGRLESFAPAMMLQGLLALDAGNVEVATEYLGNLVGRIPNSITARKLYATAQLERGDPTGAYATVKPIIDAGAADARTLAIAGSAQARLGNQNEAQELLEQAEELSGDAAVRNQLAMSQLLSGEAELAEGTIQSVLEEDEDSLAGLMMLTLLRLQDGEFADAETAADRVIEAFPDLPIGYNLRGGALLGQNQREAAKASFEAAIERDDGYAEARRNLAQVLIAEGDVDGAKTELREVVATNPQDVRALMTLAELAGVEGDRQEQLEWLQQATSANPEAAGPRIALADAYLASGDDNRAQNEANALIRDFPENAAALFGAARIYEANGRQSQLVSLFDRMQSIQPNALLPRILLGRAQQANGDIDEARRTFERALTITGEETQPAYLELIALEARQGRLQQAREWSVRLRNRNPESNVAENALGRAYMLAGRPQDALAAFDAARDKRFDITTARGIADAYIALGRRGDAVSVLQTYQKANPNDPGALGSIAELQLEAGQYRQAVANYESLRRVIGNRDPAILNNLAYAYLQLDDPRAVQIARTAYNIAPRNAAIADTYGWSILKSDGDAKLALNLLRRASQTLPRNAEIKYHLAEAYLANGQRSQALTAVREALQINEPFPERAQAQALLRRLGG
ncbi:MAG: XrtA/PEP-CTERM system TPR-repeat protein PrsT [Pacificimonas sp.]|jgi:putative PEP-CTERM system TPR-repeat lipoprotein|nr:XrtA/PEP-CTERM system TPR-repeat protein PrsT [Pacificimonas sp.]